ncbi:MAG: PAS domain S-box protein, partial [Frankiales bacterium]|nr:PAS domain S-box protein [Frankiales bacterium]
MHAITTIAAPRVVADSAVNASSVIVAVSALVALAFVTALLWINRRDRRRLAATSAQLAESEARLRQLAETVPAGIFHVDAAGRRLYVNPRLTEITGDVTQAPGEPRTWVVYDEDLPHLSTEWSKGREAKADVHVTFRIRRMTDGAVRWVHVDARPLLDNDGEVSSWVGSTVDVTEETTAIGELRRFGEILEATPDLVAMV